MPIAADIIEALRLELRRGTLILAVLGTLRTEKYGYTLKTELAAAGVDIDEGALYPMLRRLETQGLLASEWREEAKRQKGFYWLVDGGGGGLRTLLPSAALSCPPRVQRHFPRHLRRRLLAAVRVRGTRRGCRRHLAPARDVRVRVDGAAQVPACSKAPQRPRSRPRERRIPRSSNSR